MRLGIDLDNTLVCYDKLFGKLAAETGIIPSDLARNKQAIRDYLRAAGREEQWTLMQGLAYGSRMDDAECFADAASFIQRCHASGVDWWIISHRSRVPYLGDPIDLHDAARRWLVNSGLIASGDLHRVFLELTVDDKLTRIRDLGCDVFIDDLTELLLHAAFPTGVRRILFDPTNQNPDHSQYERATSWSELGKALSI